MATSPLDLFSTSPTTEDLGSLFPPQKSSPVCDYNAPYFCYKSTDHGWTVVQGCCNHWDCGRCGEQRAKQEYGRIVEGCREIAKTNKITFITLTCRGREITANQAEQGYLAWTNKFLDAARAKAKRSNQPWIYVQVTERQGRGHPHSHILTTFDPGDTQPGFVEKWTTNNYGRRVRENKPCLRSIWLAKQVVRSGLGEQYDISFVETVEGASRYVAKYLFKPSIFTDKWPKKWKRVRYSQSFPRLPERETNARVLLTRQDWDDLAAEAVVVRTTNIIDFSTAEYHLRGHDTIVTLRQESRQLSNNVQTVR